MSGTVVKGSNTCMFICPTKFAPALIQQQRVWHRVVIWFLVRGRVKGRVWVRISIRVHVAVANFVQLVTLYVFFDLQSYELLSAVHAGECYYLRFPYALGSSTTTTTAGTSFSPGTSMTRQNPRETTTER